MRALTLAAVAGLLSCGGDGSSVTEPPPGEPPPGGNTAIALSVVSTEPRNGATDVAIGSTVAAAFSVPLDPATLDAGTFTVNHSGARLPAPVSYDAATRAARTPAPLLPGETYEAILGTGVRGTNAAGLTEPYRWNFATRGWRAAELDRGGVSAFYSSLAIDATARRHVAFGSRARLLYGTCAAQCDNPANWQTLAVEDGSGGVTSVAVDPEGRVHVSYYDATTSDLRYAVCASACTTIETWQSVAVDETGDVGFLSSLAVDPAGVRHIAYYDAARRALRYAACASGCTTAANWSLVTVDARDDAGRSPSIAVDGAGRLHIAYYAGAAADLRYATCALGCGLAANWQSVTVDQQGDVGAHASLALARQAACT